MRVYRPRCPKCGTAVRVEYGAPADLGNAEAILKDKVETISSRCHKLEADLAVWERLSGVFVEALTVMEKVSLTEGVDIQMGGGTWFHELRGEADGILRVYRTIAGRTEDSVEGAQAGSPVECGDETPGGNL